MLYSLQIVKSILKILAYFYLFYTVTVGLAFAVWLHFKLHRKSTYSAEAASGRGDALDSERGKTSDHEENLDEQVPLAIVPCCDVGPIHMHVRKVQANESLVRKRRLFPGGANRNE